MHELEGNRRIDNKIDSIGVRDANAGKQLLLEKRVEYEKLSEPGRK